MSSWPYAIEMNVLLAQLLCWHPRGSTFKYS